MQVPGSRVLVTGGASGIGAGVARDLLAHGASVALLDLPQSAGKQVAQALGPDAHFVPADISDAEQVQRAVAEAANTLGGLDVLVGCAGIAAPARVVARDGSLFPLDTYRRSIEVNLIGAFDVLRHAAGAMVGNDPSDEGERGLVVQIGSIAAFEGQVGQAAYSASKGGLVAMTLPLARDLATHGVRVMTICPGTIDTPMVQAVGDDVRRYLTEANVFPHRLGTPGDIAAVVRTCMETTYLNGEVIRVDAAVRLAPR